MQVLAGRGAGFPLKAGDDGRVAAALRVAAAVIGLLLPGGAVIGCSGRVAMSGPPPPPVVAPSNLTYAASTVSATVGTPITPDTNSVDGSSAAFSVKPGLPAGLALDSATGTVSGTPTAASPSAEYAITAANSAGSATATLTIAVAIAKPSNLSYAAPAVNDVLAQPMAPDAPAVTGTVSSYSIAPALPTGLALDATTGILSGTPRTTSPATVYTVTAANSSGSATTQLSIAVNASESVLLEQGHGDPILAIRATTTNVLSEDTIGHWVLWDYSSGAILTSGDGAAIKNQNEIDLAGQLAVVATADQVEMHSTVDGHLILAVPTPSWWKLASDGSYLCAGTSASLTAWTPSGDQAFSLPGDYHAAIAYAAPGQIQLAGGPAGANAIETDSFPGGDTSVSKTFVGSFYAWFADGHRFLTKNGDAVRVYSSAAEPQALLTIASTTSLTGQGNWFWTVTPGYPFDKLDVYAIGGAAPAHEFLFPFGASYVASGASIGVLQQGSPAMSVVDLSGSTPVRSDYSIPPIAYLNSFAAASASQWIAGSAHGVLVDGASLSATRRYFGFGAVYDIAGSSNRVVLSTAIGKVLVFNSPTPTPTATIEFAAGKLALSTDGSVLAAAAEAWDATYLPDRTLNLYSLPSTAPSQSFPSSYGDTSGPFLLDFSLSGSGAVLGQVLQTGTSGNIVYSRMVTNIESGSTLWSDTGAGTPILLSADGSLIATATTGKDSAASSYVTHIYRGEDLVGAAAGTGQGWIDDGHLLVLNYTDSREGPFISQSSLVDPSGAVLTTIPLTAMPAMTGCTEAPAIQCAQFAEPGKVYDPVSNSMYSLPDGELLWQVPVAVSQDAGIGAVAGSRVIFETGHQVVIAAGP